MWSDGEARHVWAIVGAKVAWRLGMASLLTVLTACGGGGGAAPPPAPPPASPPPAPPPAPQATVSYLHVFSIQPGDGAQPEAALLQASDGSFYGITLSGGGNACMDMPNSCGTVFRMTPDGKVTIVHAFGASATDGHWPAGPLIQGRDGALYGLTARGGLHGAGTAYRIAPDGSYSVLHSFGAEPASGKVPTGRLLQASDGNFYGATATGGANHCSQIPEAGGNCGTLFRLTPAGQRTTLHSFGGSVADGVTPNGSLLQAADGNFYGTTVTGGANSCSSVMPPNPNSCGTVFRMTPDGTVTVTHSFGAYFGDGIAPQGPLIQGRDGALYGTTGSGGGSGNCGAIFGCGTVFRLPMDGSLSILYAFAKQSHADGSGPVPYLIQARDGNFYGSTRSGGASGGSSTGTAFKLTPNGALTTLHSFGPLNTQPTDPGGGLIEGSDGAFYGITVSNGRLGAVGARWGAGAVFKLTLN